MWGLLLRLRDWPQFGEGKRKSTGLRRSLLSLAFRGERRWEIFGQLVRRILKPCAWSVSGLNYVANEGEKRSRVHAG